jgi:MFS transporter, DHA1 family, inner membrane transport protein
LTLLTTLFAYGGLLMVYTYIGLTLDHVTKGDIRVLAGILFLWGVAATAGNLLLGRLVDRFGSREIINGALVAAAVNFAALPWTSAHMWTALITVAIWGICGWGLNVPQQHRLVTLAPHVAPLLLALNNTAIYAGLACSGLLGGIVILVIDVHYLSLVGAASIFVALVMAELAHLRIIRRASAEPRETADV